MSDLHFSSAFESLAAEDIHDEASRRQAEGWRYVQMLAVNKDDSVDVVYSYMKDGTLDNLVVNTPHDSTVSTISDVFFEAFVCENEIHDLYGITFDGLVLDFLGNFYKLSSEKPMTIISPEQLAEREKQRKIAAAKAAKEAKAKGGADAASSTQDAELEAKLEGMDPEKAAKVRAAMKAKAAKAAKEEAASKDAEIEAKLAGMDPEKAAKVRAAMEAKAAKAARASEGAEEEGVGE